MLALLCLALVGVAFELWGVLAGSRLLFWGGLSLIVASCFALYVETN